MKSFSFRPNGGSDGATRVIVGEGALAGLGSRIPAIAPGRWFTVSSGPVLARHGGALLAGAAGASIDPEPLVVPDGEPAKSWGVLGRLLNDLVSRGLKRDGGVVAFGGGTVGDVAGLAASLALRGVPVVQVPTTLLAASDSALGGKTAVDLTAGKNLAGTVHHPRLVVADTALLRSLPDRAYRSGLAEVVKSAMLDAAFHRAMPRLIGPLGARETGAVAEGVYRSLRMKARVVAGDPLERTGARFVLNLGHTVGHALETASEHRLAHGEAVAWGLLAMLRLSVRRAGLAEGLATLLADRVRTLVQPPPLPRRALAGWRGLLGVDKKADRSGLRAVVLHAAGRAAVVRTSGEELATCLDDARERYNSAG